MRFFRQRLKKPTEITRPTLLVALGLIVAIAVLGTLSLRQHRQLQQLTQLSQQKNQDQTRTTGQLVDQLINLAGSFDQRIEREITEQFKNTSESNSPNQQQQLLQVQKSLQNLSAKVQQLNDQIHHEQKGQISDQLSQRLAQLNQRLEYSQDQITEMVRRYRWAENVVADLSAGVCLIQGEYMFVDPASDLPLRFKSASTDNSTYDLDNDLQNSSQFKPVSVSGTGEILKVPFTASGFLVDKKGYVLSNKHILTPWSVSSDYQHVLQAGYQPKLTIFQAFFSYQPQPYVLNFVAQSDTEDVALLSCNIDQIDIPALPCQQDPEQLKAGQSLLILGYPTGFEALLARLGHDQLDQITAPDIPIDQIALNLAQRRLIQPIGTSGICGRVSPDKIIYDAQTATGGSGSPVLAADGKVVAINTALLKGFPGTNFGIPIKVGLDLINQVLDNPPISHKPHKR